MNQPQSNDLPRIPLRPVTGQTELIAAEQARLAALIAYAERRYPGPVIALGDRLSRRWLENSGNPYLAEIETVARALGRPGAYFLNLSYEWACTCSVGPTARGDASRLTRVLDWPFDGLGAQVLALRQTGSAGDWINLTWPGFTGAIQGLAPGRFAAAFNQAPLRRRTPSRIVDWGIDRLGFWGRRALPPGHLLRQVFERAQSYAEAKQQLIQSPLAMPAIFSLAGTGPEEHAVIERLEQRAVVHEGPQVAANHWRGPLPRARARGVVSEERARVMGKEAAAAGPDLAWLRRPVLNETTRLVLYAEPAAGRLVAQGFEAADDHQAAPATAVTELLP
ncbi:hypothetical protein HBA54_06850 [Pelagibius litoralis]|uniref:Uncharacterized protein n=1 Tax=Pelagibius litoralis TaxID=374515 RepID=A0A967C6C8_9PROT|nr:hypothetical protein [Pelagibius litoralis]NIA68306.1 hypothetical protein [Pelagibius litoralis]